VTDSKGFYVNSQLDFVIANVFIKKPLGNHKASMGPMMFPRFALGLMFVYGLRE